MADFGDNGALAVFRGDDLIGSQEAFHGLVGISMSGDEIDGDVIFGAEVEEFRDPRGSGSGWASYSEAWADGLQVARGVGVEVEVRFLAGNAAPEVDVGFVPDFEVPLGDFLDAVAVDEMLRESLHQLIPLLHALGGRDVLLVPEGVEVVGIEGKLFGHEADFDHGADAVLEKAIVDLIDNVEIEDRLAAGVFVIDAELIVKTGVEAHVPEIGDGLYSAEVVAVTLAQGENGAAGAEHLFPEVREGSGGGVGVDVNLFCGLGREKRGGDKERNEGEESGSARKFTKLFQNFCSKTDLLKENAVVGLPPRRKDCIKRRLQVKRRSAPAAAQFCCLTRLRLRRNWNWRSLFRQVRLNRGLHQLMRC